MPTYTPFKPIDVENLKALLPPYLQGVELDQRLIPRLAKEPATMQALESAMRKVPSQHQLVQADSRDLSCLTPGSVHLVLTSPPYWTLKEYETGEGQLGAVADYETFLLELDKVWASCERVLAPGGRLICVVGDVCLSRRKNKGVHMVMPLHASIQEHCRALGYHNLSPILWHKIANAKHEAGGASALLGKPYEPNAVIKNDIEYILMQRKPGPYREKLSTPVRLLSAISDAHHKAWFQQIWTDVPGASTKNHPAPYPLELAQRLIRMFSFVGDTILDPFAGSGTTTLAAAQTGRNSISIETVESYLNKTKARLEGEFKKLPSAQLLR